MKKEKSSLQSIVSASQGYTDNFPKREMWREIVKIFDGEFKIFYNSGHELEKHKIIIPYKNKEIIITVSDTRPLKFSIDLIAKQNYEFIISWEGFIEKIAKMLGKKEIEIGWKKFDDHYLIESKEKELTKQILTSEIQKIVLKNNIYSISYQTNWDNKTSELLSVIQRQTGDKERIIELVEMHKLLIDNLLHKKIIV